MLILELLDEVYQIRVFNFLGSENVALVQLVNSAHPISSSSTLLILKEIPKVTAAHTKSDIVLLQNTWDNNTRLQCAK